MNSLITLVKMQLKDKIDFSFLKSTKQTIFKVVFTLLKLIVITAIINIAFSLISSLRLTSLSAGIPTALFSIIFSLMFLLSLVACITGLVNNLYFAKDNFLLNTLPTSKIQLFSSKCIVFLVYEFIRNTTYFLPLLIAYGLINNMGLAFILWAIISVVIITLLTVSISALLSIPALYIMWFFKNNRILQYTLLTIIVASVVILLIMAINAIPANFDLIGTWSSSFWEIQDFFKWFTETFSIFYYLTYAFVGERYGIINNLFNGTQFLALGIILATIVVVCLLAFLLVRPLYTSMSSKQFEFKGNVFYKSTINKQKKPFLSAVLKEFKLTFRNSKQLAEIISVAILLPCSIFLLNKIFGAMDTRFSGLVMTMAFNMLMIMLIALSSSTTMATIYSKEGNSAYLIKTSPTKSIKLLVAKLLPYGMIMSLSLLCATLIFTSFAHISAMSTITIFLTLLAIYWGHLLWSAELDIMNPQNKQYATTGTRANNPNEIRSTLLAVFIAGLVAFGTNFLYNENPAEVWGKLLCFGLIFVIYRIYMFNIKIKLYYKEKQ